MPRTLPLPSDLCPLTSRQCPRDATVIGAGPAGCVAAIVLARAGWNVALIEQHRFPRDKVCGECLSALGIEVLERLGLRSTVAALDPVQLTRAGLVAPSGKTATIRLPRPMWGISRRAFDMTLLDAARDAGATIHQPARCELVEANVVTLRDLTTNAISRVCASCILLADGKGASGLTPPPRTTDLGVKAHFADVSAEPNTIALFGLNGHYAGLAPIEHNLWNLAMSVPIARVRSCNGDFDALWAQCRQENRALANALDGACRVSAWLASPLPRFGVARHWGGIIPLGNAAAALEPIGGEGMGLAMCSAELAATSLATSRHSDAFRLRRTFRALWRTRSIACRASALLLSRPRLADLAISLAAPLAPAALRLIGK